MYCSWLWTERCEPADVQSRQRILSYGIGTKFRLRSGLQRNTLKRLGTCFLLLNMLREGKGKAIPLQAHGVPGG
jgi:hypothetical protein